MTNWLLANNLENVVYKLSAPGGKEYVFANPNSLAQFLSKNRNTLNNYLNSLPRNENIEVHAGNLGVGPVRGPFGTIKPGQIQKVRLVGERKKSEPVNLSKLMANMRFTRNVPNISTQNTSATEARNRRALTNAVIREMKEALNSGAIQPNSTAASIQRYLWLTKQMITGLNNPDILNLRNLIISRPNLTAEWWETNGQANRNRRNMIRRTRQARAAVVIPSNVSNLIRTAVENGLMPQQLFTTNTNNTNSENWRQRSRTALNTPNTPSRTFTNLVRNWHFRYIFGATNTDRNLAQRLKQARNTAWRTRANAIFQQAAGPNAPANLRNRARSLAQEIANSPNASLSPPILNMASRLSAIR